MIKYTIFRRNSVWYVEWLHNGKTSRMSLRIAVIGILPTPEDQHGDYTYQNSLFKAHERAFLFIDSKFRGENHEYCEKSKSSKPELKLLSGGPVP